jgi:uncharacterized protein
LLVKKKLNPLEIIAKFYLPGSRAYSVLVSHSEAVAKKALEIAVNIRHLGPDEAFIEEAAMLHDIGACMTNLPQIGCHGGSEYICHGYLGRELLEREGFPRHALVCERHVGVGISVADIDRHHFPIPRRDMRPLSLEEKIICYADKFFSKRPDALHAEKSLEEVRASIARYGKEKLATFEEMHLLFSK